MIHLDRSTDFAITRLDHACAVPVMMVLNVINARSVITDTLGADHALVIMLEANRINATELCAIVMNLDNAIAR